MKAATAKLGTIQYFKDFYTRLSHDSTVKYFTLQQNTMHASESFNDIRIGVVVRA